ncbi:DEAD/DEAH box helicase [Phytoactinopolyspora halotolerans]|uniref:DEAD/DEAH box helicase n=1 Tax=Phytoactinopolyspora halotolerans TaxID=1981512 RepID=A0A6L9S1N7_9ACTN|nr:DEAD/DEAH box helicase [Phytoactinopolyspora halotolerans]NED99414.1 DEAD/DEAH box helicase [Phytoactinopolyspora halotolerans]
MTIDQSNMPSNAGSRRSHSDRPRGRGFDGPRDGSAGRRGWQSGKRRDGQRFDRSAGRSGRGKGPARERSGFDPARRAAIEAFDPAGSAFSAMGVPELAVKILGVDGIVEPTAVQAAVIPDANSGRDVLGRARTGSGKTLAFGLPVLGRLAGDRSRPNHPRALIVVPTRELAGQVTAALEPLADAFRLKMVTVYGGSPYDRQIRRLDRGADVVVATPGRLDDLVRRGACRLEDVEIVALDEADHLCDLGFFPVVDDLLSQTPQGGQRLLLSATLDGDVDRLVRRHLTNAARHEIDPDAGSVTTMDHHVLVVGPANRLDVTTALLKANPRSIVFTRTKHGASRLAADLEDAGVPSVDLHGDLSQRVRERNLDRFRSGRAQVVVATDVAARGIHVDGVGMVVHYDPAGEPKAYLHRSGRTARAGASGAVVTMATPGQARGLGQLLQRAGVEAKNVDARAVSDGPMTVDVLAQAPEMDLPSRDRGRSADGARNRRPGTGRGRPWRSGGSAGGSRQGRRTRG